MRNAKQTARSLIVGLLSFGFWFLPGCQAERGHLPGAEFGAPVNTKDPAVLLSLVISTSTPEASRVSADKLYVAAKSAGDPTRLSILEQILYAPGQSDAMRIYALDQLAAANPGRAAHALELYLPRFAWPVLDHGCALAVTLGDPRLLSALARSLDRVAGDEGAGAAEVRARPEFSALEKLAGRPAVDVVTGLLATDPESTTRAAAVDILQKMLPLREAISRLHGIADPDAAVGDVLWYADTFGVLPIGAYELDGVRLLHRPENGALVSRAIAHHKLLGNPADYHFAPRFATALAYTDEAALRLSREELLGQIGARLGAVGHVRREPAYPGSAEDKDETLPANAAKLSRCDLFTIRLLLEALRSGGTVAEFQRQGLADLADTTTEHGGLLGLQNIQSPTLLITPVPPLYTGNDLEYVTDDKLLRQAPLGIALYHFHFQQIHNAQRAGPGAGDLQFAASHRVSCVVVTSTTTREMDFDYYTPAGAVVDLGVYQSP